MISTNLPDFQIRKATKHDCQTTLSLITELAEYEKLAHEVVATPELLEQNLFGPNHKDEVIIGEYKQQPVEFAIFFHNLSTFIGKPGIYIEDI